MKRTDLFFLLIIHFFILGVTSAQETDTVYAIYGQVVEEKTNKPLLNVHVINKSNFIGTVTNKSGLFMIEMTKRDTLIFSSLGYQYSFFTLKEKLPELLIIQLKEKNYLLEEVNVIRYQLTANDPKPMTLGKPMIPKTEDIEYPNPVTPTIVNPIDLLYYMFGNRPKQMRQLQELQKKDAYFQRLKQNNNRAIFTEITGLTKEELESFLFFCKYSNTFINTLSDYDFLISLMACYEEYLRVQQIDTLLDQGEQEERKEQNIDERFK